MGEPIRLAFLGCGFITQVHSRHLKGFRADIACSYASSDRAKADDYCRRYRGAESYGDYAAAIDDPRVDAVVIAVPPRFHLDLTLRALEAGKHVLVEKPAFLRMDDYQTVLMAGTERSVWSLSARTITTSRWPSRCVSCWPRAPLARWCSPTSRPLRRRLKTADDWRNDESMAGGDAFFEEGIHWLHIAGSLGPRITAIHGYRPSISRNGPDRRAKSMMVAFRYDNDAVGALYYSREIPSLLRGLRLSKLYGRGGVITFESNGAFVLVRGSGIPRLIVPGVRDIRGYRAMYRDFLGAIADRRAPEMSLERAIEDQRLMDQIYTGLVRAS